jgi:hypothetical protein
MPAAMACAVTPPGRAYGHRRLPRGHHPRSCGPARSGNCPAWARGRPRRSSSTARTPSATSPNSPRNASSAPAQREALAADRQRRQAALRQHADGHSVALRALPDHDALFGVDFNPPTMKAK